MLHFLWFGYDKLDVYLGRGQHLFVTPFDLQDIIKFSSSFHYDMEVISTMSFFCGYPTTQGLEFRIFFSNLNFFFV